MRKIPEIRIDKQLIAYAKILRRDFHKHPELGFKEYRTSEIVSRELLKFGYQVTSGIAGTGVIGLRACEPDSPVIMMRFDMDALPIQEQNSVDYSSVNVGVMHACGHDAHLAIGLSIAKLVASLPEFNGVTIKIVFQPAEEGLGGARQMMSDGVLTDPKPDVCLGMHVWNEKQVGWVGIKPGAIMAGADTFDIKITGKGGHGGQPHKTVDPFVAVAALIQDFQSIVSRNISPLESGVVSFGSINGGIAANVIPDEVKLKGTIRYYQSNVHTKIIQRMQEIINGVSSLSNCKISVENIETAIPLVNNAKLGEIFAGKTKSKFENIVFDDTYSTMGSEDFAYFAEKIPAYFIFFGSANEMKGFNSSHHHPKFDIDEDVLKIAIEIMLMFAIDIVHTINSGELHL